MQAPLEPQHLDDLKQQAQQAAALLKALSNADRLLLLCQLVQAERAVTELGALAGITQPSLSQQLAVLRAERLVATRRAGKSVLYRIASPAVLTLLQTLHTLYCQPAVAPAQAAGPAAHRPARVIARVVARDPARDPARAAARGARVEIQADAS